MNYYAFHIGDYASATRHLSWDEDAAYRRLLDAYYVREAPLPLDMRAVYRLTMAQTPEQRAAVETVLREFFTEQADGWAHTRCDAELATVREKKEKAARSAREKWLAGNALNSDANAPADDANACDPPCVGNAPTPTPNPTPNKEKKPLRGSRAVPADFVVTPEMEAWAAEEAPRADVRRETAKFRDWEFKTARSDWPKAWRTWLRKASDEAPRARAAGPPAATFRERDAEVAAARVSDLTGGLVSARPQRTAEVIDVTARSLDRQNLLEDDRDVWRGLDAHVGGR